MNNMKRLLLTALLMVVAMGVKAQTRWPYINTPPAVCEGTRWDTATLRALCLNGVDSLPDTTLISWHYWRGNGQNQITGTYIPQNGDLLLVRFANQGGDSRYSTPLTVYPHLRRTVTETVCDSYRWAIAGEMGLLTNSGIYEHVASNADPVHGCDSIYSLHLTIKHSTESSLEIDSCDRYTWHVGTNNYTYTESGTHTDTLGNAVGCDSVVRLYLTIRNSTHTAVTETGCDEYTWHGSTYRQSGTQLFSYTNAAGCPSVDTLHLTINPSTHNPYTVNTCDSYTWNWGDDSITFTLGGNYTRNYLNAYGCYSTDTLHLTIRNSSSAQMSVDSCDQYTWNGTTYTQGGSYIYHTTNLAGCDSTINLSLNIRRSTSAVFSVTSCDSYTWHGTRYTASNNTATFTNTNAAGCDSVTTLNLTIHYSDLTGSENATACDNYRWHNQTYMESGDYPYSTRTTHNCDSLCTLHLTVHYSGEEEMSATSCEQYVWKGNNYIYSGDYRFDTTTTYGCDSTVILHLTIHYGTHNTEYQNVCETYEWHDSVYTTEGTHIFNYQNEYDCKSADTLHLIVYGARIPQSRSLVLKNLGTDSPQMIIFPREQGEDEYAYEWYRDDAPITGANEQYYRFTEADKGTHVFSVHASPIEQKRCYSVSDTTVKVRLQSTKQLSATPNPNNGVFTLTLTAEDEQALEVSIYNAQGNCVHTLSAEDNNISIRQTLPRGMYMVRVTTDKGNVYTEKIVIN